MKKHLKSYPKTPKKHQVLLNNVSLEAPLRICCQTKKIIEKTMWHLKSWLVCMRGWDGQLVLICTCYRELDAPYISEHCPFVRRHWLCVNSLYNCVDNNADDRLLKCGISSLFDPSVVVGADASCSRKR